MSSKLFCRFWGEKHILFEKKFSYLQYFARYLKVKSLFVNNNRARHIPERTSRYYCYLTLTYSLKQKQNGDLAKGGFLPWRID